MDDDGGMLRKQEADFRAEVDEAIVKATAILTVRALVSNLLLRQQAVEQQVGGEKSPDKRRWHGFAGEHSTRSLFSPRLLFGGVGGPSFSSFFLLFFLFFCRLASSPQPLNRCWGLRRKLVWSVQGIGSQSIRDFPLLVLVLLLLLLLLFLLLLLLLPHHRRPRPRPRPRHVLFSLTSSFSFSFSFSFLFAFSLFFLFFFFSFFSFNMQANDALSTARVLEHIVQMCFEAGNWEAIGEYVVLLSKRRGQLKLPLTKMVQKACSFLDQAPNKVFHFFSFL
jgi:hypothetical protein